MRNTVAASIVIGFFAVLPASAQMPSKDPAQAPSGTYTVNQNHTEALFSIMHLGLSEVHGRFDTIAGTLTFDDKQPERSTVSITIATASIDTPVERLNNDLKTVFRVQEYPAMIFRSTSVTRTGSDSGRITGLLTIRDVTKPVTLDVTFNGGEKSPIGGAYTIGFHATGTIRRSDFGLDQMIWSQFVSDEVTITIEALFDLKR